MRKIVELLLSYLFFTELNDYCSSLLNIIEKGNIEDPVLLKYKNDLSGYNSELTIALKRERKSKHTPLVKSCDRKRDGWFRSLKGHLKADLVRPDKLISVVAERIFQILKNHGLRLHDESYERQSALLQSLFEELDQEARKNDLELLGQTLVYTSLKEAQAGFKTAYLARASDPEYIGSGRPATEIQVDVKKALESLSKYIYLMANADVASFIDIATSMSNLSEGMNTKIRARRSAADEDDAEDDD